MVYNTLDGKYIIYSTPFFNGVFSLEEYDEYAIRLLEKEYKQTAKRDTERVFAMQKIPGLTGVLRSMIKERKETINELVEERRRNGDANIAFIWNTLIEYKLDDIKRLEKLINIKKISQDDSIKINIDKAKEIPISQYVQFNRAGFTKCICADHKEKTASMKLTKYPNGERVHCFGCGFDGDVIDVVREIYGVEFIKAVQIILGVK